MQSVTLISSPYHVGVPEDAVGAGPAHLKEQGLLGVLQSVGIQVIEKTIQPSIEADGDIGRSFEIIRQTARLVTLARDDDSFPIVLFASVGVHAGLSGSKEFRDSDVGCIWFDAHDDFNIPDTVRSGYFDSMPIAIMAGQCWKALRETVPGYRPMKLDQFVHCGLRDLNELERNRVLQAGYPVVWGSETERVSFATELADTLGKRDPVPSVIHVDLDCLDASVGQVNKFPPAPGGLLADDLTACMKMLPGKTVPASLTVASYDPRYDMDGSVSGVAIEAIRTFVNSLVENGHLHVN